MSDSPLEKMAAVRAKRGLPPIDSMHIQGSEQGFPASSPNDEPEILTAAQLHGEVIEPEPERSPLIPAQQAPRQDVQDALLSFISGLKIYVMDNVAQAEGVQVQLSEEDLKAVRGLILGARARALKSEFDQVKGYLKVRRVRRTKKEMEAARSAAAAQKAKK